MRRQAARDRPDKFADVAEVHQQQPVGGPQRATHYPPKCHFCADTSISADHRVRPPSLRPRGRVAMQAAGTYWRTNTGHNCSAVMPTKRARFDIGVLGTVARADPPAAPRSRGVVDPAIGGGECPSMVLAGGVSGLLALLAAQITASAEVVWQMGSETMQVAVSNDGSYVSPTEVFRQPAQRFFVCTVVAQGQE